VRQPHPPRGSRRGSPHLRLRVGFVVIAMVLSVFGARLIQLQGLDPNSYAAMAAAEGLVKVVLPATRGDILDRNGEPLADSVDGEMIVADPALTAEKAPELARFLYKRLDLDYPSTLEKLRAADSRFEYIARRVPSTIATAVIDAAEKHGYEGLDTRRDPLRDYPAGDVAANLIGFMGTRPATRSAAATGSRSATRPSPTRSTARTCTRHSTSTCSGTPSASCAKASRTRAATRASPSSWTRAPARSWPWPTTRRSTPTTPPMPRRTTSARARCRTSTSPARSRRS
jgi:hypothetical protein